MNILAKTALVVLGVLSVVDLSLPFVTDGDNPPMTVAVISAALGVASLGCLRGAWRGQRPALVGVVVTRLLSALLTLPVFFVGDVPAGVVAVSAATVAVTVLAIVAALAGSRQAVAA
jgi:hypothetical protein